MCSQNVCYLHFQLEDKQAGMAKMLLMVARGGIRMLKIKETQKRICTEKEFAPLENANEESKIDQNDCNCNLTDVRT